MDGKAVEFRFCGKSGVFHTRSRELPGQELFQCLDDDGEQHAVDSADVNDSLRAIIGPPAPAKRTRSKRVPDLAARGRSGSGQNAGKKLTIGGEIGVFWPFAQFCQGDHHERSRQTDP